MKKLIIIITLCIILGVTLVYGENLRLGVVNTMAIRARTGPTVSCPDPIVVGSSDDYVTVGTENEYVCVN